MLEVADGASNERIVSADADRVRWDHRYGAICSIVELSACAAGAAFEEIGRRIHLKKYARDSQATTAVVGDVLKRALGAGLGG